MIRIIQFIILLIPIPIEMVDDKKGDKHPNNDWRWRTALCILAGVICGLIEHGFSGSAGLYALKSTIVSGALFTAIFPYAINWYHLYKGVTRIYFNGKKYQNASRSMIFDHIVNNLSDSAWPDKVQLWRDLKWYGRLAVNLIILIVCIVLFWI